MAIIYPTTFVNTTFTGDTRANIASNIITQLTAAGWTHISGTGNDQIFESAHTANGQRIRVRAYDPGSGTCARVAIISTDGTQQSTGAYIVPGAAQTYQVYASEYTMVVKAPGGTDTAGKYAIFGTLACPSWLDDGNADVGFVHGNSSTDAPAIVSSLLTRPVNGYSSSNNAAAFAGLFSTSLSNNWNTLGQGALRVVRATTDTAQDSAFRWADATMIDSDVYLAWGLGGIAMVGSVVGQLVGCVAVSENLIVDTLYTSPFGDGHNWIVIGNWAFSTNWSRGSLLFAIS